MYFIHDKLVHVSLLGSKKGVSNTEPNKRAAIFIDGNCPIFAGAV